LAERDKKLIMGKLREWEEGYNYRKINERFNEFIDIYFCL